MKRFEGILICTDLDGTLYSSDKFVSRQNLAAIEYFKSEGGLFTFATGRMPYYVGSAADIVRVNAPIIASNGGSVYDLKKEEYLWRQDMDPSVFELVEYIENNVDGIGIQINAHDRIYFCNENEAIKWFRLVTNTGNATADYKNFNLPFGKVIFADTNGENLEKAERLLRAHKRADEFDFVRSEKILLEILPKNVHKGTALTKLCEKTNIDIKRTIAIGDYNNDIGMIKAAGVGVAVGNAVDEVKAVADIITNTNDDNAIARIIYDLEDGKIKI